MEDRELAGEAVTAPVPLILTKLHPPLLKRNVLRREQLIALFQQATEHRLTLVSAGIGYGKTTLLANSLSALNLPFVWYTLSRSDRDIVTFLSYLIEGLDRQWPGFASALWPHLLPTPNRQIELNKFMAVFINQLAEVAQTDFLIVLDDFHLVEVNAEVCQVLDYLLQHTPHQAHFVLSTRATPTLPCLTRLRASGDVLEIRERDFKFTPAEISTLLRQNFDLELSADVVAPLTKKMEGWALGLLLIGHALKGQRSDAADLIAAGLERLDSALGRGQPLLKNRVGDGEIAGHYQVLFEYLTEEILRHEPEPIAEFLTSSAILSWLEPALCDATLGRSDSDTILRYLERHNLFVVRTEDGWLRYHRLFRDFLYHHLAQDRERCQALHRRAALYFEERADTENTIHHRLAAGDYDRTAELIELMSKALLQSERFDTLSFWLAQLPPELIKKSPKLLICRGQNFERQGRWAQALEQYEAAAQIYLARDDLVGLSDTLGHKGQILDWWRGEHTEAERLHQEALSYLGEGHTRQRAALLRNLSRNHLSAGNPAAAQILYQEALQIYEAEGDQAGEVAALINPGSWLYHSKGDFSRALMTLRRAEHLACELGNQRYLAEIYNNLSVNLYFLWRCREAQEYAEKALALSQEIGDEHNESYALMNLANVKEATCQAPTQELYELYRDVLRREQAEGDQRYVIATLVFMSIMLRRSGNLDEAVRRSKQALPLTTEQDLRWLTGFVLVNLGAAQIEITPDEAQITLTEALKILTECQDIYYLTAAHFWLASLYHHEHNPLYLEHLRECLHLAVGHNLDYFFQSEGRAAITLLTIALEHNLWPSYVQLMLAKFGVRAVGMLKSLLAHSDHEVRRRAQEVLRQCKDDSGGAPQGLRMVIPSLTIYCFGHFRVKQGETWLPEKVWQRRKSKRLLKYIALSPHYTLSKDQLVDRLWGDLDPEAANSNFYRTLYNIRRVLEPQAPRSYSNYLVLEGGLLRLAEGVVQQVDVTDFLENLEAARLAWRKGDLAGAHHHFELAVNLYTDDLLTDDLYDDWVQPQREHLQHQYLYILTSLADLSAQATHYDQAAQYLQKLLKVDPTREESCIRLIDCLAHTGQPSAALPYIVACEKALAELGLPSSTQLSISKEKLLAYRGQQ